ncbi:MAG: DNA replication/repair protein RecF [Alphaproteobacteria bacterium]
MGVRRLTLHDFRGYADLRLDVDARPVVLTGANGAGKTNLIEAVSFLAPGRGLRQARLADVVRFGARPAEVGGGGWAVAATVATAAGLVEIGTGGDGIALERRTVRLDGTTAARQATLADVLTVTWLTPAMDRLFQEGAGGRRRFLDRLVFGFDPAHAARVSAYEHAMRERARLLREGRADPAWLAALERSMAEKGVAVAVARRHLVNRLAETSKTVLDPFPRAVPAVTGEVAAWLDEGKPALEVEERLCQGLARSRALDATTGGAALGPHRGDLTVHHAGKGLPAALCSTGEQKALLVSLILAQARELRASYGRAPVLLLDEVVAHLDEARRLALYDVLCTLGIQAWMTGTDPFLFAPLGDQAQFFRVHDATVTRQSPM